MKKHLFHREGTREHYETAIAKAVLQMQQNPSADLRVEMLAKFAAMSKYHFIRVFEEVTAISPKRFLSAIRLDLAKRLLLETSLSVTDVMLQVGYASNTTFTRTFSQLVGINPSSFRESYERMAQQDIMQFAISQSASSGSSQDRVAVPISIEGGDAISGPVFVGLFQHAVPRKRPIVGTMLARPGTWTLRTANTFPRGFLLAASFPSHSPMKDYFLPTGTAVRVASISISRKTIKAAAKKPLCMTLRPLRPFDPPILIALPLLLLPIGLPTGTK